MGIICLSADVFTLSLSIFPSVNSLLFHDYDATPFSFLGSFSTAPLESIAFAF